MNIKLTFIVSVLLFLNFVCNAHNTKTDANIIGHVVSKGEHLPFVNISIKGTTVGTTTDATGHYRLVNLPEDSYIVRAQFVGYKPQELEVSIKSGQTTEVNFELIEDMLGLDEVVVTGDRNEKRRRESSVIVNTITAKLFTTTQSVTLSEGLNFSPGLRMENNCQNCGFSQVRMNGLEGPYSQILINNRPIFSGLAGVYGLELIPSNMIERVEVIRGGGSALYGSNAIAGTINLILQDPINDSYEFGFNGGSTGVGLDNSGSPSSDYSVNANASVVSDDTKSGLAVYGFFRDREPFDANADGFSEVTKIKNTTFGSRIYHRFGLRSKVSVDFFNIKEKRHGGDGFDKPLHEANIAEAVDHDISTGAVTYEKFFRETDLWTVYASGQHVLRDSYYGAEKSLADYGRTNGKTYSFGSQYNAQFSSSNLIAGVEQRIDLLNDNKLGYPDFENAIIENGSIIEIPHTENTIIADQESNTFGIFGQYEMIFGRLNASVGARFDRYKVSDKENNSEDKTGDVLSPRLTFKYDFQNYLQGRLSYSQGYRAPQIFDEDLHIETSGSRKVVHENAPDLKQETSHSFMASLDFNKQFDKVSIDFLAEGFYTRLTDAFVNEYGTPDENGVVVYTRTNAAGGATVQGVNLEANISPGQYMSFRSGFTLQQSSYENAQEFDEKKFFRTPDNYGYFAIDWSPVARFAISATGNYSGKMLIPYFGNQLVNPEVGEVRESDPFFDFGMKFRYNIKLNGSTMQIFTGLKNIFNAYQDDFDSGIDRDPGYIYGPSLPRTIYFGIKIGNML
ncbi:MAG: TonB-dependent receptor [Prolixibacteraceae bacterium]|nr:TonB-dependent receptor [Prolixibacteraceae bacterium]